jgi:hypothetical protein
MSIPTSNATNASRARRMSVAVITALIATGVYFFANANVRAPIHLHLGLVIILLAFIPAWRWAKQGRTTLPVFELLLLTTANTYAFPLLSGHECVLRYSVEDVTTAALQVILFQVSAILVHAIVPVRPGIGRFWREEVIGGTLGRWLEHGMTLTTVYFIVSTFTDWIPSGIGSVLRAVFFGIGIICTFITSRRYGQGALSTGEKILFFANILAQCAAIGATLIMVSAISTILLALVGYVSASGRVPVLLSAVVFSALAILHNGKSSPRSQVSTPIGSKAASSSATKTTEKTR